MRAKCKNNHLIQYILVFLVWYIVYKVGFSRFQGYGCYTYCSHCNEKIGFLGLCVHSSLYVGRGFYRSCFYCIIQLMKPINKPEVYKVKLTVESFFYLWWSMFGGEQVSRFSLICGDTHCFDFTYKTFQNSESCLWGGKFVIKGKLNNTPHFSRKSMMIPLLVILQKIRCVLVGSHLVFIRLYDYIVAQEILTFLAMPLFIGHCPYLPLLMCYIWQLIFFIAFSSCHPSAQPSTGTPQNLDIYKYTY